MVKENIETILTEFQEHVEWYEIDYYGCNQSSRKRGERKRWKKNEEIMTRNVQIWRKKNHS